MNELERTFLQFILTIVIICGLIGIVIYIVTPKTTLVSGWQQCFYTEEKSYQECLILADEYDIPEELLDPISRKYFIQYYYSGDYMKPARRREVRKVIRAIGHLVDIQGYALKVYDMKMNHREYYEAWRLASYENFGSKLRLLPFVLWLYHSLYQFTVKLQFLYYDALLQPMEAT